MNLTIDPAEVNIPVTGISLDKTELTLEEGEMEALKATIEPIGASDPTVIWASSDETVAVVSGGVVKGLSSGTATITATTQDGGFTASCTVTVTAETNNAKNMTGMRLNLSYYYFAFNIVSLH